MRNVILSREKVSKGRGNFMGRGNLIQNSLQLTPFNRSRETETGKERERERGGTILRQIRWGVSICL